MKNGTYDNQMNGNREHYTDGKLDGWVSANLILQAKTDEGFPGNKPFGHYPDPVLGIRIRVWDSLPPGVGMMISTDANGNVDFKNSAILKFK